MSLLSHNARFGIVDPLMVQYDPNASPDLVAWRELDEHEALLIVERHHRSADCTDPPAPNPRIHAVMHVIVENQIAMGEDLPVARTLRRLMREGLTRHEAVHAIGSVLAGEIHETFREPKERDINASYEAKLREVTAETWRHSGPDDSDSEEDAPEPTDGLDETAADIETCSDPHCAEHGSAGVTVRRAGPKMGRNDPCPCGSGKKYKKCCR